MTSICTHWDIFHFGWKINFSLLSLSSHQHICGISYPCRKRWHIISASVCAASYFINISLLAPFQPEVESCLTAIYLYTRQSRQWRDCTPNAISLLALLWLWQANIGQFLFLKKKKSAIFQSPGRPPWIVCFILTNSTNPQNIQFTM